MASNKTSNFHISTTNIAKIYRSVYTSDPSQPLPLSWGCRERTPIMKLSGSSLMVTCGSDVVTVTHGHNTEPPIVKSDHPIPISTGIYYFETTINYFRHNCALAVGVALRRAVRHPGLDSYSYGYHSDGSVYHAGVAESFGPKFVEKDVIGCGVDFISKTLFFTRNGQFLGKAFEGKLPVSSSADLFPAIGLSGQGCRVNTNFGDQAFCYNFKKHVMEAREAREDSLVGSVSKDFLNVQMRDLVAGYLVHHGYIDSARAFSRWSNLAEVVNDSPTKASGNGEEEVQEDGMIRKSTNNKEQSTLPGLESMLHRRSLRTYCHRCQFGRAANTLTSMYSGIVDRYPELIVQLRCRQLIEMMHRHSVKRSSFISGKPLSSSDPKLPQKQETSNPPLHRTSKAHHQAQTRNISASSNRPQQTNTLMVNGFSSSSAIAPGGGDACCTSESVPTLATFEDEHSLHFKRMMGNSHPNHLSSPGSSAATSCDAMDIDSSVAIDNHINNSHQFHNLSSHHTADVLSNGTSDFTAASNNTSQHPLLTNGKSASFSSSPAAYPPHAFSEVDDFDDDYDADDGFGLGEPVKHPGNSSAFEMEVDFNGGSVGVPSFTIASSHNSTPSDLYAAAAGTSADGHNASNQQESQSSEEMRGLLRQIQFGRSLMDLVKQVKEKYGGLSPETERLIQQTVSLLAYPTPASPDCPLRCLLDPSWRDNIASLINSAILTEAHNLPPQPAIEQGLHALQQCFADRQLTEAQTLGHFLLYHLSPSKYANEMRLQQEPSPSAPSLSQQQQAVATSCRNNNSTAAAAHNHTIDADDDDDDQDMVAMNGDDEALESFRKYEGATSSSNGHRATWRRSGRSYRQRQPHHRHPVVTVVSSEDSELEGEDQEMVQQQHQHHNHEEETVEEEEEEEDNEVAEVDEDFLTMDEEEEEDEEDDDDDDAQEEEDDDEDDDDDDGNEGGEEEEKSEEEDDEEEQEEAVVEEEEEEEEEVIEPAYETRAFAPRSTRSTVASGRRRRRTDRDTTNSTSVSRTRGSSTNRSTAGTANATSAAAAAATNNNNPVIRPRRYTRNLYGNSSRTSGRRTGPSNSSNNNNSQ